MNLLTGFLNRWCKHSTLLMLSKIWFGFTYVRLWVVIKSSFHISIYTWKSISGTLKAAGIKRCEIFFIHCSFLQSVMVSLQHIHLLSLMWDLVNTNEKILSLICLLQNEWMRAAVQASLYIYSGSLFLKIWYQPRWSNCVIFTFHIPFLFTSSRFWSLELTECLWQCDKLNDSTMKYIKQNHLYAELHKSKEKNAHSVFVFVTSFLSQICTRFDASCTRNYKNIDTQTGHPRPAKAVLDVYRRSI